MSQFKPGDMALIVGCKNSSVNLGKTCELIAFLRPGERLDFPHGNAFDGVRHIGTTAGWFVAGETLVSSFGSVGFTIVREQHLAPLRGDFAPEQQKSQEVSA
jgi:hypothetical protein